MIDRRADRLASLMTARGVEAGDRVAVMVPNGAPWFEANVAAARLGAQLVPLNWHLLGEEITWVLTDSEARLLVADGGLRKPAHEALARAAGRTARFAEDRLEAPLDHAESAPPGPSGAVPPPLVLHAPGRT